MQILRRFFCLIIAFSIILSLSGCRKKVQSSSDSSLVTDGKIIIGVSFQDMSNEFIMMLRQEMLEKAKENKDVQLIIEDAEAKANKQIVQMEKFIAQRVNVIIINTTDGDALIPAIEDAIKEKIPVITISSDINKKVGQVFVGSPNISAGEMQAKYICERLKGKGNVAIIKGPVGHYSTNNRYEGYLNIINHYPEIHVVFNNTCNWQREQSMSVMEKWLKADVKIDAVLCQNDAMALGAIEAIKGAGMNGKIAVSGIDAIGEGLEAIMRGDMDATCFQDAKGQADVALEIAVKAARGERISNHTIPFELVTADNVGEFASRVVTTK